MFRMRNVSLLLVFTLSLIITINVTPTLAEEAKSLQPFSVEAITVSYCSYPNLTIPSAIPVTITDDIVIGDSGTITDVNVADLIINHTYLGDLDIAVGHNDPNNNVKLKDQHVCGSADDINATYDDEASPYTCMATSPAIRGLVQPDQPLSNFDGEDIGGTWTLEVDDLASGDGGTLVQWCIEATVNPPTGDTTPPVISNVQESADPINKQGCGSPEQITIQANVSDDSPLDLLNLWYFPPGSSSWVSTPMSHVSGNTYSATIGPFSQAGSTKYYIFARDSFGNESWTSQPTFNINECDTTPPVISNVQESADPINKQGCGSPEQITIQANVSDDSPLDMVRLWYDPPGSSSWTSTLMSNVSGSTYSATIGPFSQAGTTTYYIFARDSFDNENWTGQTTFNVNDCATPIPNQPDLKVIEIGITDHVRPYRPETIDISAEVGNVGKADASEATVKFYLGSVSSGNLIGSANIAKTIQADGTTEKTPWVSYNLPSRIWEQQTIIAEVSTTDSESDTSNNRLSKKVSIYYTNFRMDEDAFSFENPKLSWPVIASYLWEVQKELELSQANPSVILTTVGLALERDGHCYGMAYSSILYKKMPFMKPINKSTYNMSEIEAIDDVRANFWKQLEQGTLGIWVFGFGTAQSGYDKLEQHIKNDIPAILSYGDTNNNPGHAVVGYKILRFHRTPGQDLAIVFTYDNEYPLPLLGSEGDQRIIRFDISSPGTKVDIGSGHWNGYSTWFTVEGFIHVTIPQPLFGSVALSAVLDDEIANSTRELYQQLYYRTVQQLYHDGQIVVVLGSTNARTLIVDQLGRRIGYIGNSLVNEIPTATYEIGENGMIEIYRIPASGTYSLYVQGGASDNFDLHALVPKQGNQITVVYHKDVLTTSSSEATATISQANTSFVLNNDLDGDGNIDQTTSPDFSGDVEVGFSIYLPFTVQPQ